jgi:hypothetical protein
MANAKPDTPNPNPLSPTPSLGAFVPSCLKSAFCILHFAIFISPAPHAPLSPAFTPA